MAAFTSDDNYVSGHEAMDSEHQVQVGLVAALRQALEKGLEKTAIDTILDRLISYTDAHFMAEQLLMRQYAYPLYEGHVQEHDRLVEKVHELQEKYQSGEIQMTLSVAQSLEQWLLGHIKGTDHALGDYLSKQS